jgi:hypothetical protein
MNPRPIRSLQDATADHGADSGVLELPKLYRILCIPIAGAIWGRVYFEPSGATFQDLAELLATVQHVFSRPRSR